MTEQAAGLDQEQMERLAAWLEQVGEALELVVEVVNRLVESLREKTWCFVANAMRWIRREAILVAVLDGSPWWLKIKPWYQRAVARAVEWLPDRVAGWMLPMALRVLARHWGVA